jgi:hypothetical protein
MKCWDVRAMPPKGPPPPPKNCANLGDVNYFLGLEISRDRSKRSIKLKQAIMLQKRNAVPPS